jgi:hypothetical protein
MELNKELNIAGVIVFIIFFAIGVSETGYQNIGDNFPGMIMMLFGALGLLSQFVLLNISLMIKK